MKRSELFARIGVFAVTAAAVGIPVLAWARTPLIHARMAEDGGWSPSSLHAVVGEPLHLRLTSDDVVHGFAVGQMSTPEIELLPGKVTDLTLKFDKPGTYIFYCTRWCGVNHWRMRGTIEVTGPAGSDEVATPPLYVSLGLDIDATRSTTRIPAGRPLADLPSTQSPSALAAIANSSYYRSHSPSETWRGLRQDRKLSELSDQQIWNMTAWIWRSNVSAADLQEGARLFAQNCAACHGANGRGDGVFAAVLAAGGQGASGMGTQRPVDFTDPTRMLSASPAVLQGKILRGGMGTGMPSWGQIFTDPQTWDLVAYLYSFQFAYP